MKRVWTAATTIVVMVMELSPLTVLVVFALSSGASRTAEVGESNGKDKGT